MALANSPETYRMRSSFEDSCRVALFALAGGGSRPVRRELCPGREKFPRQTEKQRWIEQADEDC